jgi:predicted nucleic acid-binding protein
MRVVKLLDSFAMLAYLNGEPGCGKVREALAAAREGDCDLCMNEINIGESYYILSRKRGTEKADYLLDTILHGLPIRRVANDFPAVIAAARIKAQYPLSFAACFTVETAHRKGAAILTGDIEFKSVEHLVTIEWLEISEGHQG